MKQGLDLLFVAVVALIVTALGATLPIPKVVPQVHIVTSESYCELPNSGPACVLVFQSDGERNVKITSIAINGVSIDSIVVGASFCKSPVPREVLPVTIPAGQILRIGVIASTTPGDGVLRISVAFDDSSTIASAYTGTPNDLFCNFNG